MTKSISTAIAALLLIAMIALACAEDAGDTSSTDASPSPEGTATEQSTKDPETVDLNVPEDDDEEVVEETPEPTPAAPERIRFRRGESQGRITIALAPGESKRYVVGVAPAQYFHVGMDSDRPVISLLSKRMLVETEQGDTYLDGITSRSGDILIEFSNPTGSPIRTFALVTIKHQDEVDH